MKAIKISDLMLDAEFKLKIGTVKIVKIRPDGYGKGKDEYHVQFVTDGITNGMTFTDDAHDLKAFLNTHK